MTRCPSPPAQRRGPSVHGDSGLPRGRREEGGGRREECVESPAVSRLPYRRLLVWQRSQALAERVLDLAEAGELRRQWYFKNQMCDAAMSVPANIAEGNGRSTPLDYASFLDRARGSLFELDSWLYMAANRGWIASDAHAALEAEIEALSAMILSMATKLRSQPSLASRTPR